jgi:hypothetical protein
MTVRYSHLSFRKPPTGPREVARPDDKLPGCPESIITAGEELFRTVFMDSGLLALLGPGMT